METTAYYAFGVPLYLGLVFAEWWRAKRRGVRAVSFSTSFGNVSAGLGSIVVGLFLGPVLLGLYAFAYRGFALVTWPSGSIVPWVLAIVLADFGHYWHHRLDHRVAACWAVHGVHHMPEEMNFTVAMRHAWFSDLYSFPFYAPLPLLGVPPSHFFVATTLLSFHALITHSEHFDFPGFGVLVTPRSHVLHHARNRPYVDTNFGAMLAVWDRIFGTASRWEDANPPSYGTHRGYATHDGALAQWVLWRDLLAAARRATTWQDKLRVFFGRPGWLPDGIALAPLAPPPPSRTLSIGTKVYVAAQSLLTIGFSLYVFVLRDTHGWAFKIVAAFGILLTMVSLGGILDRRPLASQKEALRVFAVVLVLGLAACGPRRCGSPANVPQEAASVVDGGSNVLHVRPEHPRIWLDPARVTWLKNKVKGRDTKSVMTEAGMSAPGLALASIATGDPAPCREAWERFGAHELRGPESRAADEALFYDWCHPHLSDAERKRVRARLVQNIQDHMKEGRLWRSFHNAGPSAAFLVTVNALAIHGEEAIADEALAFVMPELDDMRLVVDRLFPDGEWAESMDYARHSNHHLLRTFLALSSATGRDFVRDSPNLRNIAKTIIYATKPDGRMFPSDDNDWPYVNEWDHRALLMSASTFRDPYAQWFLNHCPFEHFQLLEHTKWARLLWFDETIPDKPLTDLPLARLFAGKGIVMARSGWGFKTEDTWVAFTNGDFFGDHTHQDVNAFQIFRGADLAIDAGRYDDDWDVSRKPDQVARSQFFNYYQRTIAHNTMLVFDPSEKFENGLLNDGGQLHHLWRGKHRNVPEDYAQGNFPSDDGKGTSDWTTNPGRWERGDIVAYRSTGDFVFVRGDGTKAYAKNKVSAFVRELLFVQPRLIVVFDRVVATNAAFEKTWLLHAVSEPSLGDGTFEIKEGTGRLFGHVVLPEKRRLAKIGGPGDEHRVGETRFKAGPASVINPTKLHYGEQPGAWRIEEKPGIPAGEDHFLNVMLVSDRSSDEKPRVTSELAQDEVRVNVRAGETTAKIRFAKGPKPSTHLTLMRGEGVVFDGLLPDRVVR